MESAIEDGSGMELGQSSVPTILQQQSLYTAAIDLHRDCSRVLRDFSVPFQDPTKPPTYEIDLSRLQLVDGSSRTKSRTFILKPVDPGESALSTKQKSELCFKAPSTHVKDLWIRSLGLLCGTQQSMQMSAAPPEEAKTADCELKIPSILDSNQIKPGLAGESGVLRVDPDFRALSLALGEYLSIVRDHLVVFAVPKAVLHLFVSKVMKNLKDSLVDKLVENF